MSLQPGARIPTTADEWSAIRDKIELHARSPYSSKDKRVLWCQGTVVLLGGALYLTSLIRRATLNGIWCLKKDSEGYWHPNVHVAIPIVTITHAAIQTAGIALVVIADAPEGLVPTIVALNFTACSLLYFAGWTKVWAVLYALPSSIFRLRRRDVLGSTAMITKRRILSPKIFNRFILAGYLVGILPIPWLTFTVYWVYKILDRLQLFRSAVQELITELSGPANFGTSLVMIMKTGSEIKSLESAQDNALKNLRIFSGAWLTISLCALLVFLGGSFALLLALTGQIEILSKIQKQRERLIASKGSASASNFSRPSRIKKTKQVRVPLPTHRNNLLSRLKSWVPTLADDDDDDLLGMPTATTPPAYHISRHDDLMKGTPSMSYLYDDTHLTNRASRKNHKRLVNYCTRFAWQVVFCTVIATSYIVLNIFIGKQKLFVAKQNMRTTSRGWRRPLPLCPALILAAFNVLDAPRSITLSQLLRTVEQWAAWSWGGGPGAVLGFLACVVAFSKNPILPREPEKGPPTAADACNNQDSDLEDDDDDETQARGQHLTVEKLNMHGAHNNSNSGSASPKRPTTAIIGLHGVQSWDSFRSRLGLGSHVQSPHSTSRRNADTSSEASTGCSRNRSPFQILSLSNSNFVQVNSAKPHGPAPHYQLSHLSTVDSLESRQANFAAHKPTPQSVTFENGTKRSYHMPFQMSSPHSGEFDTVSRPAGPSDLDPFGSPALGHFEAIHQLRDREGK